MYLYNFKSAWLMEKISSVIISNSNSSFKVQAAHNISPDS